MGLPMAINLVKAGHRVVGFDLQARFVASFVAQGGIGALDLLEAGRGQDVVITMLQTGQQVQSVCLGEHGLFSVMDKNALMIDCSTIGMEAIHVIHEQASVHGLRCLDVPVSGGVFGATNASLTLMIGGDDAVVEAAKPLLSCIGKTLIHTGGPGSGQAAKLCNNMLLGISMVATSEAFLLAEKLGLSAQKLHEVVTQSSGQSWVMTNYAPAPGVLEHAPSNYGYPPGFSTTMMLKDLTLSQAAATMVGVKTPLAARATAMYNEVKDDIGELDCSAIITCLPSMDVNETA
jgi:3-hydroxyisobutyrate dehydrogenase